MNNGDAKGETSAWGSSSGSSFIRADLGSVQPIHKVVYGYPSSSLSGGWTGSSYSEGLVLEYSKDGSTWIDTGLTTPALPSNYLWTSPELAFQARYLRFSRYGYMACTEFQVFTGWNHCDKTPSSTDACIGGSADWQTVSFDVPSGAHTLKWSALSNAAFRCFQVFALCPALTAFAHTRTFTWNLLFQGLFQGQLHRRRFGQGLGESCQSRWHRCSYC